MGVRGMDTDQAREVVMTALRGVAGVSHVEAGDALRVAVEYDPTEVTAMDLIRALRRIGFLAGME
ncbi:MAG: heavy-metal-associated domain-containing protein [Trueperaceae bacterium]|nr:heavy-metal-associated domain-containing protein [Trueperaceae bacterium]